MPDKILPRNKNDSHGNKMASNNINLSLTVIVKRKYRLHISETFVSLEVLLLKLNMKGIYLLLLFSYCFLRTYAQDTTFIKVHFLYGSKPKKHYRDTESKWFGGMLGGHVGIEVDSNKILNFLPQGKFHWFASKKNLHSTYALHSEKDFYAILGSSGEDVKKAVVYVPLDTLHKLELDSLAEAYLNRTPYDYALVGMRCGAATYEILARLNILKSYSNSRTAIKILYPKKLRRRLFKIADRKGWKIVRQEGSARRHWEQD
jgi:hypothetical protein